MKWAEFGDKGKKASASLAEERKNWWWPFVALFCPWALVERLKRALMRMESSNDGLADALEKARDALAAKRTAYSELIAEKTKVEHDTANLRSRYEAARAELKSFEEAGEKLAEMRAQAEDCQQRWMNEQNKVKRLEENIARLMGDQRVLELALHSGVQHRAVRIKKPPAGVMQPRFNTSTAAMDIYRAIRARCKAEKDTRSPLSRIQSKAEIVDMGLYVLAIYLGIKFDPSTGLALPPDETPKAPRFTFERASIPEHLQVYEQGLRICLVVYKDGAWGVMGGDVANLEKLGYNDGLTDLQDALVPFLATQPAPAGIKGQ